MLAANHLIKPITYSSMGRRPHTPGSSGTQGTEESIDSSAAASSTQSLHRESGWSLLPHQTSRNQKPLFKTLKIGSSGFRNQTRRFYRDRRQSRVPSDCNKIFFLRPSDVWMVEMREPR
jgi:hypothetical protein